MTTHSGAFFFCCWLTLLAFYGSSIAVALPSTTSSSSAADAKNSNSTPSAAVEENASSPFLSWGPCDWCMRMCSDKPSATTVANQTCALAKPCQQASPATSPPVVAKTAAEKEIAEATEVLEMLAAATGGLESPSSPKVETVNASIPLILGSYYETRIADADNSPPQPSINNNAAAWPPALPEGIPGRAPITVSMLAGELYLDGSDFTPAEGEMLKEHFENFTANYGSEEQALNALKKKSVRAYVKILAIVHDFMGKYRAMEVDARAFIDAVIAFFKPVLAAELNRGSRPPTSSGGSATVASDADLATQELALIQQYKALSLGGWMSLDAEFPSLVDEIEEDISKGRGGEAGNIGF